MKIERTARPLGLLAICLLLVCALGTGADGPTLVVMESAAETDELSLMPKQSQTIFIRECDQCPLLSLSIEPATLYFVGKTPITLGSAASQSRGATVFFDKQTRIVSRVVFWR